MTREVRDVAAAREEGGAIVFEIEVPGTLVFFEGHFPGRPVLGGVAQLDRIVLPRVEARWPDLGPLRHAQAIKFHRPIQPGDRLVLRLERRGGERVVFRIDRDGAPCATGVLDFHRGDA